MYNYDNIALVSSAIGPAHVYAISKAFRLHATYDTLL